MSRTRVYVASVYLISNEGKVYKLKPAVIKTGGSSPIQIWGGDRYEADFNSLELIRTSSGRLLDESFHFSSITRWGIMYVNYNNMSGVSFGSYGLDICSKSKGGWAVRGIITKQKIFNLNDIPLAVEVDLEKTNTNVPDRDAAASPFAACLYLSSNKKRNPYNAKPWFAVKLYPRSNPYRTVAQLVLRRSSGNVVYRNLYTWYSAHGSHPRGIFLLIFNETNKVYYYFWKDNREGRVHAHGVWTPDGLPEIFQSAPHYIYLTIDNRVTASSRHVWVRYLKIYHGTSITITGLMPGWEVVLDDENGKPMLRKISLRKISDGSSISLELLSYIISKGMPLKGKTLVYPYRASDYNPEKGWMVQGGHVKKLIYSIQGIPPGKYTLRVLTLKKC